MDDAVHDTWRYFETHDPRHGVKGRRECQRGTCNGWTVRRGNFRPTSLSLAETGTACSFILKSTGQRPHVGNRESLLLFVRRTFVSLGMKDVEESSDSKIQVA